jgi:hypothetical protein
MSAERRDVNEQDEEVRHEKAQKEKWKYGRHGEHGNDHCAAD